ncbi:MAG: hypothetical protein NC338_01370 [Firmicutes bacterium]|nr:hypothetical protein [Bacillota bacterium]MCM1401040.1 hypothetical protein [Bacteroides sp.]MCM1476959.1 hypothetical protein [Bacteroides sp.]
MEHETQNLETTPVVTAETEETGAVETTIENPAAPAETETNISNEPLAPAAEEENTPDPAPDIDLLIAEAEQRGYLRGLNEAAEARMQSPVLLENLSLRTAPSPGQADRAKELTGGFLANIRKEVWD